MLWSLLMQLYVEWKSLVLKRGLLTGLMQCCGFSRHMRCQLACMPVRFGLHNFWSMTMVSAILCRSHTWRSLREFWELNLLLQTGVCFENARRNFCNFTGSGQLSNFGTGWLIQTCHAQSLAATNRVTEQLSWLVVESFFMSCSVSCWMASLIDNLYLLDLIVLVINWQHVNSKRYH